MKKGKTKEEESFRTPKNDLLILQWSNTALGNRLDHIKKHLFQLSKSERKYYQISLSYQQFFSSFFSAFKSFLVKFERLNLLAKKQEGQDRHQSKFKLILDQLLDFDQVNIQLKEHSDMEKNKSDNDSFSTSMPQQINDKIGLFLKTFEEIYSEVIEECVSHEQRVSEVIKNISSNNDQNETIRRIYKENTQLQTRLKQLEDNLQKQPPIVVDPEKQQMIIQLASQTKHIQDLTSQLSEERELSERLSLRLRHKMDYSLNSIQIKTGSPSLLSILQQGSSAELPGESAGSMELEDQFVNFDKSEYECLCGGTQVEYTRQKFEEQLKKLLEAQIEAKTLNPTAEMKSSEGIIEVNVSLPETEIIQQKPNQNQLTKVTTARGDVKIDNRRNSQSQENGEVINQEENTIIEDKMKMSMQEKLSLITKQNKDLMEDNIQQERVIGELELEIKNVEEKFFHSGVYIALITQTEELVRVNNIFRIQLRDARILLEQVEKLRKQEMQELISKFQEERQILMKEAQDAKEGVLKENLAEIMRTNLEQHFNYKKYTTPLQEQIDRLSSSLESQRLQCKNLEEQKQTYQQTSQVDQKMIADLQTKVHEKEQTILLLESKLEKSGSVISDKSYKNSKHKEILVQVEKILLDQSGQSDLVKNFREVALYFKGREEKINLIESKYKQSENEKKKLQSNIDQIWKDYESLDSGFTQLKKVSDTYTSEKKTHEDREQELESANLEILMKYQKEQHSHKILLSADQHKKDAQRQLVETLTEQNKILIQQNQECASFFEEIKAMNTLLKSELEEQSIQFLEVQQKLQLLQKKYYDLSVTHNELISDCQRTKAKLQNAYDLVENMDNKELKNKHNGVAANVSNSAEQEQIKNLTSLLQCQCGERIKDAILYKCLHPFCRQCIDKQVKIRSRACPKCRTPFSISDIKTLYLSN